MGQQVHNQAAAAAAVPPAEVQPGIVIDRRLMHKLIEQFLRLKSPRFNDVGNPKTATLWLRDVKKIFTMLRCLEEDRVLLATYQLQGNASTWWEATQRRVFPEGIAQTWGAFCEAFNGKSFLDSVRESKMVEF
ncbi:uncharacterized protein LOC120291966 [Eucalyptus grandis]|uniref:uncharacterized protein LOC120291966 n=1 Tax=Eucalyptus grandis TaxID=71139 RepID=UPI00192EBCF1|nr:uncharacterized protein LOC120291966 [Eucalyptus grandis]